MKDGLATSATFNSPTGITTDGKNLYTTDFREHIIRKIVISTGEVTTLNIFRNKCDGILPNRGSLLRCLEKATKYNSYPRIHRNGEPIPGMEQGLYWPRGITTDGKSLYVTDRGSALIRKIEISTGVITTLAGTGKDGNSDGIGKLASFNKPGGITTDGKNLYIIDNLGHSIRKLIISTGEVTTIAGSKNCDDYVDGIGKSACFNKPRGITTDGKYLYITENKNHLVRKIEISTGEVSTLAGTVSPGWADGIGKSAKFNVPAGITTDGTNLYVTDEDNHMIRKIEISSGKVTTLAGTGSIGGKGRSVGFHYPLAITTDGKNLFIADYDNHIIKKM